MRFSKATSKASGKPGAKSAAILPAAKPGGRRALVEQWLAGRTYVGPEDFAALCCSAGCQVVPGQAVPGQSAGGQAAGSDVGYLRKLVRQSGIPMHPLVEGVRQESLEELERTLRALDGGAASRALVLTAKQHARFSLRSPRADRAGKQEMILWMTVWLETPELFASWVTLRKKALLAPAGR